MRILQNSSELISINECYLTAIINFFNCSCIHSLDDNGLKDESLLYLINLIKSAKSLGRLVIQKYR